MALRRGLSEDPFDALLSTARGIGFSIPELSPTLDDIQSNAFIDNLLHLIQTGGSIPEIEAMLRIIECNGSIHGLLDCEMLQRYIEKLKRASKFFSGFAKHKGVLMERLMREDVKSGIPVERKHQRSFCRLIDSIARDKYKLFELATEAKMCVASNASPIDWKSQCDALRGMQDQLKMADRRLDELSQMIARYAPQNSPPSAISRTHSPRDIIMKD